MSIYRDQFKQYILRRLGAPTTEIDVTDDQLEDRIDDALQYFTEHHFDGAERIYMKHVLTAADVASKTIPVSDLVTSVVRVVGYKKDSAIGDIMFSPQYQFMQNYIWDIASTDLIHYDLAMQHLNLIDDFFAKGFMIRHNKTKNVIELDNDWSELDEGDVLMFEVYRALDPETYWEIYQDRYLKAYATALVKYQWGSNLSKFEGVQLPGGLTLNGTAIKQEAEQEIERLEEKMRDEYSEPLGFFTG